MGNKEWTDQLWEMVENAPIGFYRITADGKYLWSNSTHAALLGYPSRDEFLMEINRVSVKAVYAYPETRQAVIDDLKAHPNTWKGRETTFLKRDGSPVEVSLRYKLVTDGDGKPFYIDGFMEDITEEKQLKDRLKADLEFWQTVLNTLPLSIYLKDGRGRYTFVNKGLSDLKGIPPRDFIGRLPTEIIPGEEGRQSLEEDEKVLRTGLPVYTEERRVQGRDGLYWFQVSKAPILDEEGKVTAISGCSNDVTTLKEALDSLERSEKRYRSLAEDMPIFICTFLPDGTLLYANSAYSRYLAADEDDLLGRPLFDLLPPEEGEQLKICISALTPEDPIAVNEPRIPAPGGAIKWHRWINRGFFDPSGRLQFVQAVGEDVTASKLAEDEVRAARDEAQRASAAKSEFLATISHEIRTPMNGVLGMSELLLETALEDSQKNLASMIHESAGHLLKVLNDLLDFSQIESGNFKITPLAFPLDRLLEDTIAPFHSQCEAKDVRLFMEADPSLPSVLMGDPVRIRQILTNLLSNAVKFTDRGAITLSVRLREEGDGAFAAVFSVADTGTGIDEDLMKDLFTPFKQGEAFLNRRYLGTGLGLSICQSLAKLMGGSLKVASTPGMGSIFTFTLPLKEGETPEGSLRNKGDSVHGRPEIEGPKPLILVVDDNKVNRELVRLILQKAGCLPETASDGREGLTMLARKRYDLVFMDIQMPVMDGYEATAFIRDPASPALDHSVPVVALTAHAGKDFAEDCLKRGMNDYLPKPFSSRELLDMLYKWLPVQKNLNSPETPSAPPPEAPTEKNPFFDRDSFFANLMGDREEGKMLLELFLESLPEEVEALSDTIKAGDLQAVKKAAHTIKGMAAGGCAMELNRIALALQTAAENKDRDILPELFSRLQYIFSVTAEVMRKELEP